MSKKTRPVVIEPMEQRRHFDVSFLTETIDSSTLPSAISDHAMLHGAVIVTVANNSGADVTKAKAGIGIFISSGTLDVPSGQYASLGSKLTTLNLLNGASKVFTIPIHIAKGKLNDGVDTLTAVVAESGGGFSDSGTFGTLTVHPPIVTFSETETFLKLPDSTAQGSKFHVTDKVAITNSGTDPSTDAFTVGIYATPLDGIPADSKLMTSVTRKQMIAAGKTVTVPVNIAAIPALGVGTYKLITQVTQTIGTITTTDPSTAPEVTVATPTTGPQFSDSIFTNPAPTLTYAQDPNDVNSQYLSQIKFEMSITNSGTATTGGETFTLFASTSPNFNPSDPSTAAQIGQVPLDLPIIPHNGKRNFFVEFGTTQDLNDFSGNDVDLYLFVQVKDATGNVTMANYPTLIKVAGPSV
jgi:hypothetical protein